MTPRDILQTYHASAAAFRYHASAWILALTVCDAGEKGLTQSSLRLLLKSRVARPAKTLRQWQKAGLIVARQQRLKCGEWQDAGMIDTFPPQQAGSQGGKARVIWTATPKLFALLRVTPV